MDGVMKYYRSIASPRERFDLIEVDEEGLNTRRVQRWIFRGWEMVSAPGSAEMIESMANEGGTWDAYASIYGHVIHEAFDSDGPDDSWVPISSDDFEWYWMRARRDILDAVEVDRARGGPHRLNSTAYW